MSLSYAFDYRGTYIEITFFDTLRYTSITQEKFTLEKEDVPVTDPFQDLDLLENYNSISRVLRLYFADTLEPDTSYTLTIEGLVNAAGEEVPSDSYTFTTEEDVPEITEPAAPTVEVVDHSIKAPVITASVLGGESGSGASFVLEDSDPKSGDYYVDEDYKNGRVTLKFSMMPNSSSLSDNIKVQKKSIQRAPSRWETVSVHISRDSARPWVYIDFPSTDESPVYHTDDSTYFETNNQYRILVGKNLST